MRAHPSLLLAALGVLASACSDSATATPDSGAGAVQAVSTPTPVPETTRQVPVTLHRFPAGLAVIGLDATVHQLTVEIKVGGLTPGSTHAARLVASSCAHPGAGAVLHELDALTVDDKAISDTRTVVSGVAETAIPASGWSLIVDGRGGPAMCGDLLNPVGQTVITAGMGVVVPPAGPDPKAAGTATLGIAGGGLQLVIDATGLTPGSTHAAQLRRGNCEGQGKVLHDLAPLTADATGHATSTTQIAGIGAIPLDGWFVGVTLTGMLDPVLCGNVGG